MSEVRGGSQEEIPHAPSLRPGATGGRSYPMPLSPRPRAAEARSNPTSEVRGSSREELPHAPKPKASGGGREEQPHVQGARAARAQEGLEELSHVEGQEGRW